MCAGAIELSASQPTIVAALLRPAAANARATVAAAQQQASKAANAAADNYVTGMTVCVMSAWQSLSTVAEAMSVIT